MVLEGELPVMEGGVRWFEAGGCFWGEGRGWEVGVAILHVGQERFSGSIGKSEGREYGRAGACHEGRCEVWG